MAEPITTITVHPPSAADPATPRAAITVPERVDGPRELLSGEA